MSAAIATAAVLLGAPAVAAGAPSAPPAPAQPITSSSDEIADMVMDAIQQAPPTLPVPPPPAG
jgi:hypothetical protein